MANKHSNNVFYLRVRVRTYLRVHLIHLSICYTAAFTLIVSSDISKSRMSLLEMQDWVLWSKVYQLMGTMQRRQRHSTPLAIKSHRLQCCQHLPTETTDVTTLRKKTTMMTTTNLPQLYRNSLQKPIWVAGWIEMTPHLIQTQVHLQPETSSDGTARNRSGIWKLRYRS